MLLKYALGWVPMIFIAIGNGMAREFLYGRHMPELAAHQASSLSAVLLFFGYAWMLGAYLPLKSAGQAVQAGLLWLVLTVAFEFSFGHYVAGHSWQRLLADYDLAAGRVWVLVLLALAVLPYVVWRLRRR